MDQESGLEIAIPGLTNLDVMELQNALASADATAFNLVVAREPAAHGKLHDPALAAALIKIALDNAHVVLPMLTSAIAIWIAKGKRGNRAKAKTIDISLKGVKIASFESDSFQESDAAAILARLETGSQTASSS